MKRLILVFSAGVIWTVSANAADSQKLNERIEAAHSVLHELIGAPDKGIPEDIAGKATCVPLFPQLS